MLTASLSELPRVARELARFLAGDYVIFLQGDLAAGKTTLVKALANVKGVKGPVTSPTFSIQQIYGEGFYHYDLYQCPTQKFFALGLAEAFESPGWHLVEWGEEDLRRWARDNGFATALIQIIPAQEGREYRVEKDA